MAKFTNELALDVSPFLAGLAKAKGEASKIDESLVVSLDVDTSEVDGAIKKVNKLDGQKATVEVDADTTKLEKSFGEAVKGIGEQLKGGDFGGAFESLNGALAGALPGLAAVTAGVGAIGAALGDTIAKGREFNDALRQTSLQTGLVGEGLEKLEDQAKGAFQKGVGESVSESVKILGTLKQALGNEIPVDQLGEVAVRANSVAKSLNVETTELVSKLSPLMKQYNLTFDEALEKVSAGAQNGIADLGGYLDTVNEFTVNAKEAGFGVDEFTASLEIAGQQGVKDLAKVGDGIKEIENRIKSGDLQAGFGAVSGQIGADLQNIAKLGAEGALSGKEVLQQSIDTIDKAFQGKQISKNFRDNLLTQLGGSIAEDVGSDVFTNIFKKENIDKKVIEQTSREVGDQINANIPPPDLGRIFETLQTEIGQAFDTIYKQFIGPVLAPILDGLGRIKDAFAEAFSGGGGLASDVLGTIADLLSGVVSVAVERVVSVFTILADVVGAVFDGIKAAVAPVIDAFSDLFASTGEGVDIFEVINGVMREVADVIGGVLAVAVKILLKPLEFLGKFIAFVVSNVIDVVKAIADWVAGLEFVQDAIAFVSKAIDAFVGTIKAVGDAVGGFLESIGFIEKEAPAAGDAIAEVGDAAADTTEEIGELTKGVNELAIEFNNALAAAQANLANYQAAGAATGKYRKEIAAAAAAVRKLEAAQDSAALAGDPARQRAIQDQLKAAVAETVKLNKQLNADLILDATERERALLKLQQEADDAAIEQQIETQKRIIAIGGAGLPEARAQLTALEEERKRIQEQGARDRLLLEASFQQTRLANLQASESLIVQALASVNDRIITQAQKQLDARNLTQGNIDTLINANVAAIKAGAEAEVKALIESAPEYQKARAKIDQALATGVVDADEAQRQIKELLATYRRELEASTGDDPLGQQVRTTLANAEDAARESAKAIRAAIEDAGIAGLSSEVLRGIDSQVAALRRQRDLLLTNVSLTEDQRKEIEEGFAKAIDKVNKGPMVTLRTTLATLGDSVADIQFDLNSEAAGEDAEALQKQIDAINASLRAGEITYQDALEQLANLQQGSLDFVDTLGAALGQAFQQTSDTIKAAAGEAITAYKSILEEQKKVAKDSTITEEQRGAELTRLSELAAEQQTAALEAIGAAGATSFAALIASGADAGEAILKTAGDTAKALLALYTPDILALFTATIPPPFGFIAGAAAVASLQALLATALSGFEEGGFTGGREGEVRGVVHGAEYVANARTTRRERALFQFLDNGGTSDEYFRRFATPDLIPKTRATTVDNSGAMVSVLMDVRDRLDRIPNESFMKHGVSVDVGLDTVLYQKQQHRQRVRGLR